MEWFRITYDGPQDPIKDMLRDDYEEPKEQIDLIQQYEQGTSTKSLPELMAKLDCHVGNVDGYAYGSYDRLSRMRKKGVFKPIGPSDMYKYPGTDSMKYGWDQFVNEATDAMTRKTLSPITYDKNWCRTTTEYRKLLTDVTRYYQDALLIDRCFKF